MIYQAQRIKIRSKINNLQSAFPKEMKKVTESKRTGASADGIYVPK
jgi:hypothetical protein